MTLQLEAEQLEREIDSAMERLAICEQKRLYLLNYIQQKELRLEQVRHGIASEAADTE